MKDEPNFQQDLQKFRTELSSELPGSPEDKLYY